MVSSAKLAIYGVMDGQQGSEVALGVYCMAKDWDPKTITWLRSATGVDWTSKGGDYLSSPVTKSTRGTPFVNSWETITVTDHVKRWLANRSSNYGFMLAYDDGAVEWIDYVASEGADPTLRPKLTITYTSNSGPVGASHPAQFERRHPQAVAQGAWTVDGRKVAANATAVSGRGGANPRLTVKGRMVQVR